MVSSDSSSSSSCPSSPSDGGGATTTAAEDHGQQQHGHQLAAETPKKRTGRRVFRETRHPVYRGVRSRKGDKWVCELREPNTGTRVWLGTYTSADMAARAHDVAALAFRGKSACLNFADSAWRLPIPVSTDGNDIRRAAAEAAEMFRPGAADAAGEEEYSSSSSSSTTPAAGVGRDDDDVYSSYNYVEEEMEVVDMPRLLSEMAEGLLLSPPRSYGGGGGVVESDTWSYVGRWNSYVDPDWSTLWN